MALRRAPAPGVLRDNAGAWTDRLMRHDRPFRWPEVGGESASQPVIRALLAQTDGRCSYCDHFPLGLEAAPEIDHYQPKSRFRALSFDWANLFGSCRTCNQSKGDRWDEALLRPDDDTYTFFRFFDCDALTGLITPRSDLGEADRVRALSTIGTFGWNDYGRPLARAQVARTWPPPASRPYRFLFPDGTDAPSRA